MEGPISSLSLLGNYNLLVGTETGLVFLNANYTND
jgi:hypothetical protein